MDAKLIKNADSYAVKINNEYVAFANEDFIGYATQEFRDNLIGILSLKNCQAIELGYDLDELASDIDSEKVRWSTEESLEHFGYMIGIKDGFQKALSILGDKKFSEEDVRKAYTTGWNSCNNFTGYDEHQEFIELPDCIQSLQQTEWDVIIVMECDGIETGLCNENCTCNVFPKLDADGCLILKRKI